MKPARLWLSPLLVGAIAAVPGCGDATPVGVGFPTPPEAQLVGSPVQLVQLSCSPLLDLSNTQTLGPQGGTLSAGPHELGGRSRELTASVNITAVAPSDSVNRTPIRLEGLRSPKPAPPGMSYQNCSLLRRRSNYAVAW